MSLQVFVYAGYNVKLVRWLMFSSTGGCNLFKYASVIFCAAPMRYEKKVWCLLFCYWDWLDGKCFHLQAVVTCLNMLVSFFVAAACDRY